MHRHEGLNIQMTHKKTQTQVWEQGQRSHIDMGKDSEANAHQPRRCTDRHMERLVCPQTHTGSHGHMYTWVHSPTHTRRHLEGVRGIMERQTNVQTFLSKSVLVFGP